MAHGRITALSLEAVRASPGVVAVLTSADIPGRNACGAVVHDDPLLADDIVQFYGQPLFLVVAATRDQARKAARLAKIEYAPLPPVLTAEAAANAQLHVLPTVEVRRGDASRALSNSPHRLKGAVTLGGQEHFYLEGQVAYAIPREDRAIHVRSSTQHPTEMQHLIAHVLGWHSHQVSVECRRMGGGFGGKESQSAQVACAAAVAATLLKCPVKVRLDRDDDMQITGKRHDFHIAWDVGFDDRGRILGIAFKLASRCGFSADLSGPVNDRAVFHADNAYFLDAVSIESFRGKTNTVSNTAFRGFGGPQGMFAIEYVLEEIATYLKIDPLEVRQINFYGERGGPRSTTHYGMAVETNLAPTLVLRLANQAQYSERRKEIERFNAASPIIKRGIALTPVKFGISFTATHYNQGAAQVSVYTDGTVLITHGGTEMGQGLYTKVRQIVADEFGLPLWAVRFSATDTSRIVNTSATAASSGTDLNGKAAQQAARAVRDRLVAFVRTHYKVLTAPVRFAGGLVFFGDQSLAFSELTGQAYRSRISLSEQSFYRTPKIHFDRTTMQGRPFFYFAYGAACSEVAIDTLTGESKLLRVDILHDVGRSINPAIDIGQIEGGFIQGVGWLTSEELVFEREGRRAGRLMTHSPSTYKIPTASDCPATLNVTLFQDENTEDTIYRSKAVGEPPLMLALSAFFALRNACSAAAGDAYTPLHAPATPEAVLRAIHGMADY
jgi:xanthine dehydrogenase large subunit